MIPAKKLFYVLHLVFLIVVLSFVTSVHLFSFFSILPFPYIIFSHFLSLYLRCFLFGPILVFVQLFLLFALLSPVFLWVAWLFFYLCIFLSLYIPLCYFNVFFLLLFTLWSNFCVFFCKVKISSFPHTSF